MKIEFFSYYGGKYRLISQLISLIPPYVKHWCELFGGSGVVTINKSKVQSEWYNDFDYNVANLFFCMSQKELGLQLMERIYKLKYDKETFEKARDEMKKNHCKELGNIDCAVNEFVIITQSYNATRKSFSDSNTTENYQNSIRKNLRYVYERLQGVKVTNLDAINDILPSIEDKEGNFIFLDPPYRKELRGKSATNIYRCELSNEQQIQLMRELQRLKKSKVLLCGYKSDKEDLYDKYLLPCGWHRYKIGELTKPNKARTKGIEWVWVNYELPECAKYYISLSSCDEDV